MDEALGEVGTTPKVQAFFGDSSATEDPEFVPFGGQITQTYKDHDETDDPNLCNSGYGSLKVTWDEFGDDAMSPWEVKLESAVDPVRPSLTDEEKETVRKALSAVKAHSNVEEFFSLPVDQDRYTDYPTRVEIPMDLTTVSKRLEADYYATRLSAVFDGKHIQVGVRGLCGSQKLTSRTSANLQSSLSATIARSTMETTTSLPTWQTKWSRFSRKRC